MLSDPHRLKPEYSTLTPNRSHLIPGSLHQEIEEIDAHGRARGEYHGIRGDDSAAGRAANSSRSNFNIVVGGRAASNWSIAASVSSSSQLEEEGVEVRTGVRPTSHRSVATSAAPHNQSDRAEARAGVGAGVVAGAGAASNWSSAASSAPPSESEGIRVGPGGPAKRALRRALWVDNDPWIMFVVNTKP